VTNDIFLELKEICGIRALYPTFPSWLDLGKRRRTIQNHFKFCERLVACSAIGDRWCQSLARHPLLA